MVTESRWWAGVDLGGTTIKCAFIDSEGQMITNWEIPTDLSEQGQNITRDIAQAIEGKLEQLGEKKEKLGGIGMGAPGFLDMETGYVFEAVNIGWKDFPLKEKLEEETGLQVTVDNDANLAALGERWQGAGDGASQLLFVTLGTGVGGGVIVNGQIVHGINGMAGEIGHITAVPEGGYACNCGKTGCLETVASATGLKRLALEEIDYHPESTLSNIDKDALTAKDILDAAKNEDTYAILTVEKMTQHLGIALANAAITLNPEKIVIGGGVSKAGDTLLTPLRHYMKNYSLGRVNEAMTIEKATLGNEAGVYGGAWLAKNSAEN